MITLTPEEVNVIVEKDYLNSIKTLGEIRVLGTFLIGPYYKTVTIFFPTVQDIAINCTPLNAWLNESEHGGNRWVDFRLVADLLCDRADFVINLFFTNQHIISPSYQKLFSKLKETIAATKIKDWKNADNMNIFAEWWAKIFDHYLQFRDGVQDKIFDSLTKTEEKALVFVLETIGDEGILSISTAIQQSGISRPVFTSLLDKLDRYKGAEVKNMGVKGTYINFHDHILSKFEIS